MRLSIGPDRSRFCMEFVKRESGNSYQTAECYLGQTITTWLTYLPTVLYHIAKTRNPDCAGIVCRIYYCTDCSVSSSKQVTRWE